MYQGRERQATIARTPRRILVISATFPSHVQPNSGVFVKERVKAIANLDGYEVRVISPVPYFPPIPQFKRWYEWSQFAREETIEGIPVVHPRYFLPPKVGGYVQPLLMWRATCRAAEQIRTSFDFDLIDAHWSYPNGVVATALGRHFQRPVVITGRGEDMLRFPDLPLIGRSIRRAMRRGNQFIALSEEIARSMRHNGADPERITLIPNGVDCEDFKPVPRGEARRALGLAADAKIIVSVGNRDENKGFHLLVDALTLIQEHHADVRIIIVGGAGRFGSDFTPAIQARIRAHNAADAVMLPGNRPHEELKLWYNAADVFALLSSREGSPNVLMEALACGVPAVATAVGGIPEVLSDPGLGIVIGQRSPEAAAKALTEALGRNWDRASIRKKMESRSWDRTAKQVAAVFERTLSA